jgi:alpha-1,3-rhamnosyl/mannosyltransferase
LEVISAGSGIKEGYGGAARYYHGIIPPLSRDPRVDQLILYVPRWYERAEEWVGLDGVRVVRCRVAPQRPLRVGYEQIGVPLRALSARLDVLLSPANYRPLLYRGCNVVTLHAIQQFLYPDEIGRFREAYLKFAVPRSVRTADLTITVTETLRADAIKLWGLDPERVVAAPMGPPPFGSVLGDAAHEDAVEPYRLPGDAPYVMCISRLYGLKNHRRLIRAYGKLTRSRDLPHQLVIVGGDADITKEELAEVAAEAGVRDRVVFLGRVPQSRVGPLYAGASAIAYPSLYETFGHPVLEAFATGTPLLTSITGATAEVAGGAARMVDPEDEDDIAAGLADVLLDAELRGRLVDAGARRLRDFSWERCAERSVDVLARAVERRRTRGRPSSQSPRSAVG